MGTDVCLSDGWTPLHDTMEPIVRALRKVYFPKTSFSSVRVLRGTDGHPYPINTLKVHSKVLMWKKKDTKHIYVGSTTSLADLEFDAKEWSIIIYFFELGNPKKSKSDKDKDASMDDNDDNDDDPPEDPMDIDGEDDEAMDPDEPMNGFPKGKGGPSRRGSEPSQSDDASPQKKFGADSTKRKISTPQQTKRKSTTTEPEEKKSKTQSKKLKEDSKPQVEEDNESFQSVESEDEEPNPTASSSNQPILPIHLSDNDATTEEANDSDTTISYESLQVSDLIIDEDDWKNLLPSQKFATVCESFHVSADNYGSEFE